MEEAKEKMLPMQFCYRIWIIRLKINLQKSLKFRMQHNEFLKLLWQMKTFKLAVKFQWFRKQKLVQNLKKTKLHHFTFCVST